MKNLSALAMRLAPFALCATLAASMFAVSAHAQQPDQASPPPPPVASPADTAAPTSAMSTPAGTMTKAQLKQQRKQQKLDEASANATAKAAKAQAGMDHAIAKSKQANDQQLQAQEKAGQITPAQPPTDQAPPPPPPAPQQ